MYQNIKSTLKNNFSEKWLQKNELWLRAIYSRYFLKKGQCQCSVCGQSLKEFVTIGNGESICPACGSGKRHRRLFQLLKEEEEITKGLILDFSPNTGFSHFAEKTWGNKYLTTNYNFKDFSDFHYNITEINARENHFSTILCYHVLEHVPDDEQAINELFRILTPGGKVYIQTPFKDGEIYEDWSIVTPEERLAHFDQEDHVRIYSANGLAERLSKAGFHTEILHYIKDENPEEAYRYGFKDEEFIILAKKPTA